MNIIRKLMTAIQGGAREAAEVVVDANGLRILGQEIHECEQNVASSKQRLALIIAEKTQVKRQLDVLKDNSQKYEAEVLKLLKEGNEEAAMKIAEKMAEEEPSLLQKQEHFDKLKSHEMALQGSLKKTILGLDSFKSEYKMAKATDSLQKAQSTFSDSSNPASQFNAMKESLDRIHEKQQESTDKMDAMDQVEAALNIEPLDVQNNSAPSAEEIIQRIKDKKPV